MAKEGLFNILRNRIEFEQTNALDLFSGTGSIAFELISRGCLSVVAVDQNRSCAEWIRKGTKAFSMNNLSVVQADSFKFIARSTSLYDLIFADPPYNHDRLPDLSQWIFKHNLLKPGGWLIIEHPESVDFSKEDYFYDHRHYSKVNFSFFHYLPPN